MTSEQHGEIIWMRPDRPAVGRPAQRSRAQITEAAIAIADAEGLDAVSMRRLATDLGTGAATLYRYVDTREDLIDLMIDAVAGEYSFAAPSGDWLADLIDIGKQARAIERRHPWLPSLVLTRPVLGPNALVLLEHVLELLARHQAPLSAKLEAFALLNTITAVFVQFELAGGSAIQQRNDRYLQHLLTAGTHPRLADLLSQPGSQPAPLADRYADVVSRVLTGMLGQASGDEGRAGTG